METDNIERYDRQIRLWGQHGQTRCSSSKVCLINADSLGTEILKGLCLAGIGSFTILDSHKLTPEDVGCNFIPQTNFGKSRAEAVKNFLLNLNEVNGEVYPVETYLPHFITQTKLDHETTEEKRQELKFWKQFNCVIVCGFLYIDQITRLSKLCWSLSIPLIVCKSIGFFGSMSSQIREHLVIETHPDNVLPDFNLDKPFNDLSEYFDSIDLEDESKLDKINSYPYVVIVYKYLRKWQKINNLSAGNLPNSYSEKVALKKLIDEGLKVVNKRRETQRCHSMDTSSDQVALENYLEASKAINSCLTVTSKLPDSVNSIFKYPRVTDNSNQSSSRFWLIIRALKEYVERKNGGRLPVSGSIPDMTSSSEEYIRLQSVYARKAREDVDNVFSIVQTLANSSNYSPGGGSLYDETKLICKNIRDLQIISTSLINEEYDFKDCEMSEENEDDEFITIGLCLKAMDIFYSTYSRIPGCQDNQIETDISKLKDCLKQVIGKISNRLKTLDQCLYELCRYGGAELHATSAFMGGCVAQEAIKLVTNQYVPVDNTFVYNAMTAATKSFKFRDIFSRL